jgi:FkbM family methyltransferase
VNRKELKRAIKTSPLVKKFMLGVVIPAVRGYIRFSPFSLGKKFAWSGVCMHHYGLEPLKWDFTVRTVFGSRVSASTRDMIGRYIYYFGVWEPNLTHWIRRRLAPGETFIDVGANLGYYSLLASRLVGDSGRVVAIEALPAIFSTLQRNLAENRASNVRAVNQAAWDREQKITIYTNPETLPGQTTVSPVWAEKFHLDAQSEVAAAPLSVILQSAEIKSARLIKIDVEGAEWQVLAGMKPVMTDCRDDLEIMTEVNRRALEAHGQSPQDVLDFFRQWGFNAYRVENDYLVERYIHREAPRPPRRIREIPDEQADVIFSRVDAESL